MKRFYLLLPLISVLMCLMLVACAPLSTDSGISGHAVIQSAAPGNASPASKAFTDAVIIIRDPSGKEITRAHVDSQGGFKIYLPAGSFSVEPQNDANTVLPRAEPQAVEVVQGAFTDITLTFK
jgi:hypothetical protein